MGLSCRRYLIDHEEHVIPMKSTTFERLMGDPANHKMPSLAGQRVRFAELLLEVKGRTVLQIVRRVYFVLPFDQDGQVDTQRFQRQMRALASVATAGVFSDAQQPAGVLDAAERFVAQGGRWHPSPALVQRIDKMALG